MDFPCWLYVFALCSILPTDVHCQCGNPGPGRCNANNSQFISDREVVSPSTLSCPFQGSLCNYRQGCRDKNMSTWTAGEGYSQASQKRTATCGQTTYSVLESRWIQFSIPVCLQFSFSRYSPVALAVFFEPYPTGSTAVITLLAEDKNTVYEGNIQVVNVTINKTTGKVLFRIYGGAPRDNRVLKLYPVSYQDGRCETPGCNFTGDSKQMCGWTAVNWKQATYVSGVFVDVVTTTHSAATLTSPLHRATGENHRDCLTFKFRLKNATDSLTVAVKVSGVTTTVWSANNLTSATLVEGQVQIVTFEEYQIVFIGHKPQANGRVIVSDVSVSAKGSQDCAAKPKEAAVIVTRPLESTPSTSSGSSTAPSPTQEDQKESDVAAISGGVAAAVIVIIIIAVVIITIIVRRRRRSKKDGDKGSTMAGDTERGSTPDDVVTPSIYDSPGELSRPNPYGRLQATTHNVSAATATSAVPSADISMTEATSYYNVGGNGQSADSSYQNIEDPVTSANDDDETNYYEQM